PPPRPRVVVAAHILGGADHLACRRPQRAPRKARARTCFGGPLGAGHPKAPREQVRPTESEPSQYPPVLQELFVGGPTMSLFWPESESFFDFFWANYQGFIFRNLRPHNRISTRLTPHFSLWRPDCSVVIRKQSRPSSTRAYEQELARIAAPSLSLM